VTGTVGVITTLDDRAAIAAALADVDADRLRVGRQPGR